MYCLKKLFLPLRRFQDVALKNIIKPLGEANKNYLASLTRWALMIQKLCLRVFTVTSEKNGLVDFLTRAGAPPETSKLKELADHIEKALFKEDNSVLNLFYEGRFKLLDRLDILKMHSDRSDLKRLNRTRYGRIKFKKAHLDEIIAAQHAKNVHQALEMDVESVMKYNFGKIKIAHIRKRILQYRKLCLNCQRYPHLIKRPLNRTISAKKIRAMLCFYSSTSTEQKNY